MNLLLYTFWIPNRPICKALFELKDALPSEVKVIYVSGDKGLKTLVNQIKEHKPKYILGLGYYGNSKKIRLEQEFKNLYGRRVLFPNEIEILKSNWDLNEVLQNIDITKTNNAGNSRCNQYAYTTVRTLNQLNSSSKFAYLHIPKGYSKDYMKGLFVEMFKKLNLFS